MLRLAKSVWRLGPLCLFFLCLFLHISSAQIRYTIPEELTRGAFVGNIAKDLGTEVAKLAAANLQVLSDSDSQYLSVNVNSGVIVVNDRIDREHLCGQYPRCFLHLKLAIDNPVELYRIEVEILDINDNPPEFPSGETTLQIYELASLGARFPIAQAQDPDVGSNALQTYRLSANENFSLNVKARTDGCKFPELVLERALDREQRAVHHLVLTAEDGGSPPMSSKTRIAVQVLDANDNHPVFDTPAYRARLVENSPSGTLVIQLNATDMDEGPNGDLRYSLSSHNSEAVRRIFAVHEQTGEIRVQGDIDFEEDSSAYELTIRARDKGSPAMEGHCSLRVELVDVNDNSPDIVLTSLSSPVLEDAPPGTVIALIGAKDSDSGGNGHVHLQMRDHLPFTLVSSFQGQYSLVTAGPLDREKAGEYNITITATDSGSPRRATEKTISLQISDVNDNTPHFSSPSYTAHIQENTLPGASVLSVSASDPDMGSNSKLSYSILDSGVQALPLSTYFHINPENGTISTLRALDYEQEKVFQVPVQVKDAGAPPLSSTATVHVFVLDENDNTPTIVYPPALQGSAFHQTVPLAAQPGYLVTKIVAVDGDSGHNAWLSYWLQESSELCPFRVERHSGEIRITEVLRESEAPHRLVVQVRDNGTPPLSASVVLLISLEERTAQDFAKALDLPKSPSRASSVTLYLIISLVAISLVSCVMLAVLGARCLKSSPGATGWALSRCCRRPGRKSASNFSEQLNPEGFIKYLDVGSTGLVSQAQRYKSCFSPMSDQGDFLFIKPFSQSTTREMSPCDGVIPFLEVLGTYRPAPTELNGIGDSSVHLKIKTLLFRGLNIEIKA
uniref:Cadherin domain-containing protein n=1 Tax=Pelusios castaneus TaxID=367368 RepID=A0A8C8SDY2_9SAUR